MSRMDGVCAQPKVPSMGCIIYQRDGMKIWCKKGPGAAKPPPPPEKKVQPGCQHNNNQIPLKNPPQQTPLFR